jgi:hypothetical protein
VDIIEAAMHTVNLELHSKFSDPVALKDFVLFVVKVDCGEDSSLISTIDGERVVGIVELWAEIPVIWVMHPY